MRKILLLLFFLPLNSFSFDESYFDGPINQCICAVIPDQCNKNCKCDPHCTKEQKDQFDYSLPETFSNNKIGCDPNNRIDKTNLNSINKEIINGVNCYSIKGKENGKKITNYNAKDFGIENFSDAVLPPFDPKNKYIYERSYRKGDKLIGVSTQTSDTSKKYFYLPIAIGSSTSNALMPILAGYSYRKYSSRINSSRPISYLSRIAYIKSVFDQTGEKDWLNFTLSKNFNREADKAGKFLLFQYIFPFQYDAEDIYFANKTHDIIVKATPDIKGYEKIDDLPDDFLSFSFEVYFGDRANYIDNEYQDVNMGYYYGVPIMGQDGNASTLSDLFGGSRKNLQVNNETDVLFGVNSTIIVKPNNNDLTRLMMPLYTKLYETFGNVYVPNMENRDANDFLIDATEYTPENSSTSLAVAEWRFYYVQAFKDKPLYRLKKFNATLKKPNQGEVESVLFNISFYEIDSEGKRVYYPKYDEKFLSLNYSAIFDVFFRDESETLETTGVFLCFALIGTIWCWYSCFFYIED